MTRKVVISFAFLIVDLHSHAYAYHKAKIWTAPRRLLLSFALNVEVPLGELSLKIP